MERGTQTLILPTDEQIAAINNFDMATAIDEAAPSPESSALELSFIRKLTTEGTLRFYRNKRYDLAHVGNSYGLPAGDSCPGATPFCAGCYGKSAEEWKSVAAKMERNMNRLVDAGTVGKMIDVIDPAINKWEKTLKRRGAKPWHYIYRPHWNGDYFSEDYAAASAEVMKRHPKVSHWVFTRSIGWGENPVDVIPILAEVPNLALYMSVDHFNQERAREVKAKFGDLVRIAWCGEDTIETMELSKGEGTICPENVGDMELMVPRRTGNDPKELQGACPQCRHCIKGDGDVHFTTGRTRVMYQGRAFPIAITPRVKKASTPNASDQPKANPEEDTIQETLFTI